jgi:hypothetical protein
MAVDEYLGMEDPEVVTGNRDDSLDVVVALKTMMSPRCGSWR